MVFCWNISYTKRLIWSQQWPTFFLSNCWQIRHIIYVIQMEDYTHFKFLCVTLISIRYQYDDWLIDCIMLVVLFKDISIINIIKGCKIKTYARHLWPLSRGMSLPCHTCYVYDTVYQNSRFHPKDCLVASNDKGYWWTILTWTPMRI